MRNNIPSELRQLPQWVVSGPDKKPLSPRTGQMASVTDPNTWATYEEAIRTGMVNIGFVLTEWDPFTIIDLDNKPEKPCTHEQWQRHQKILQAFDSYTERSASGTGYHIIVKGKIPSGVNRDNVEAYSSARYMICTGNVVRNTPIGDYQPLLDILYGEMKPADSVALEEYDAIMSDEDLLGMAMNAANGDKFNDLCSGDWVSMGYQSQSEADLALLSILAYYTKDNEQVRRLFRMSGLGKREKAQRGDKYINTTLMKIRANEPPEVDFSNLIVPVAQAVEEVEPTYTPPAVLPGVTLPPGIVGEIAQYIFQTAIRPVPEIALAGAIGLVAGVAGRSYNISGSGLNHYIIVIANTGAGKEGAATGIDNLIAAVRPQIPMVDQFIGPSSFASGQGLVKTLDEKPCFLSIMGEFGITLQQLCSPTANSAEKRLKQVMLDLFSKSGWNKVLRGSAYSDSEKNTKNVQAPNVTILGESTPETFFDGLSSMHISEGLIPRFSIIEYKGIRPPRNRNANCPPPPSLVKNFAELVAISLTTSNNQTCANVQIDTNAQRTLDELDAKADGIINSAGSEVELQLWNRAHLKALKMAAIIAVGCNPHNPVITGDIAQWAVSFVEQDVRVITERFKKGEVGTGDHRQEEVVRQAVSAYLKMTVAQRQQYKTPKQLLEKPIIPFHYLRRRVRLLSAFKNDRRGIARALDDCLKDLVKAEVLQIVPPIQAKSEFGVSSELYVCGSTW